MFIIFRDFVMVEQIFLSPQVKRSVILLALGVALNMIYHNITYITNKLITV